jgi:rhodanese-related sulfurtransferase
MKRTQNSLLTVLIWAIAAVFVAASAIAEDKRITKEEVMQMLGSPDLIIIDVRAALDWEKSARKIKGAIREDPDSVSSWMSKYPKDKTIAFYCS